MGGENPELIDRLMANGFMLEVFMIQVLLEIARQQPNPESWAREFVSRLHARVDENEARVDDRRYPTHELARQGFDRLGQHLVQLLQSPTR